MSRFIVSLYHRLSLNINSPLVHSILSHIGSLIIFGGLFFRNLKDFDLKWTLQTLYASLLVLLILLCAIASVQGGHVLLVV